MKRDKVLRLPRPQASLLGWCEGTWGCGPVVDAISQPNHEALHALSPALGQNETSPENEAAPTVRPILKLMSALPTEKVINSP